MSWITILKKRPAYRKAFERFDPVKMSRYGEKQVERLLADKTIVRNRLKVEAFIANARTYLDLEEKGHRFDVWIWDTVEGEPIVNRYREMREVPAHTPLSDQLSKRLKAAGFRFVGPTVCYAFMQAAGMVNDHLVTCFRHPDSA